MFKLSGPRVEIFYIVNENPCTHPFIIPSHRSENTVEKVLISQSSSTSIITENGVIARPSILADRPIFIICYETSFCIWLGRSILCLYVLRANTWGIQIANSFIRVRKHTCAFVEG